jgi:hypothetical protein
MASGNTGHAVERSYTLSADKLPVCLPELGLSGKNSSRYKTTLVGGDSSERT